MQKYKHANPNESDILLQIVVVVAGIVVKLVQAILLLLHTAEVKNSKDYIKHELKDFSFDRSFHCNKV
jgi:hypothetical protein